MRTEPDCSQRLCRLPPRCAADIAYAIETTNPGSSTAIADNTAADQSRTPQGAHQKTEAEKNSSIENFLAGYRAA